MSWTSRAETETTVLCLRLVMFTSDEHEEGGHDTYTGSQVIAAAVDTLGRDLAGQAPENRSGKTKNLLDAGSL